MKRRAFLFEYIKNIREVGAVAPSSRYLARKMCEPIDFTNAKVIVEYGPGTGAFTKEIVKRMAPSAKLLIVESNPAFYRTLQATYADSPAVIIIHGSAEHVAKYIKQHKLARPDYVVSGLPFAALPADVSRNILRVTAKVLGGSGMFITFQYTLFKRTLLGAYFGDISIKRELRNVPPAYVLICRTAT